MNTQAQPTIEQTRFSLCTQLIGAGITQPEAIVNAAQAIEDFIFGTAKAKVETSVKQAKPETTQAVQEVKQTETKEIKEKSVLEQPTYNIADIKSALMRVAKADRNAFQDILDTYNVKVITAIDESDYPSVIAAVEKFEAENA